MTDTTSATEIEAAVCHVCGIIRADVEAPAHGSLIPTGTDVRVVPDGDVAAIVVMIEPDRALGKRSDLLAHSGVLNAVADAGEPVIPVRFGSVLASEDAVAEELLRPNRDRWMQLLDELDGHAQFTLRGTYVQERVLAEIVAERPDVAALRERTLHRDEDESHADRVRLGELVAHAMEERRAEDTEHVRTVLEPHCTAIRATPGGGIDGLVDVAALVADDQRAGFEQAAEDLAAHLHERATFRLLGPLAPFDFVDEG